MLKGYYVGGILFRGQVSIRQLSVYTQLIDSTLLLSGLFEFLRLKMRTSQNVLHFSVANRERTPPYNK